MWSNRLRLNLAKSECMWCCTSRRLHLADISRFNPPDGDVEPSETVVDLGAFFDQAMTMNEHVNRLVKTCNFQLRRIRSIRRLLPMITVIQLVNSFLISRIDYYNSILLGLPKYEQDRLKSVLNVAARLIHGRNWYDHITDLLRVILHWFRVSQRITFKCCLPCLQVSTWISPSIHSQRLYQKVNYWTSIWTAFSLARWLGYSSAQKQVRRTFFCSGRTFGLERTTWVS